MMWAPPGTYNDYNRFIKHEHIPKLAFGNAIGTLFASELDPEGAELKQQRTPLLSFCSSADHSAVSEISCHESPFRSLQTTRVEVHAKPGGVPT